jgi:imidazolonepropionase-like amidohydrolase
MTRAGLLLALLLAAAPASAQVVAIIHAKAYPITPRGVVEDATLVFTDGRIVSLTAHGAPPAGAQVIDAAGRIVTPGLMNGATQLGLGEVSEADDTQDQAVKTGPLGPAFDIHYALNANSVLVQVARADGLTRAMSYPAGAATAPFSGAGALIRLSPGPDILERPRAAVFAEVGDTTLARAGGSRAAQWVLLRNALIEARRHAEAPKTTGPRDQLLSRPDVESLGPVISGATPLAITAERQSDIREAIALATDLRVRVVVLGGSEAWTLGPELAAAHVPVVLDPEVNLPQTFDRLGARLDNAALLAKAGVAIAFSVSGNGIYLSYDAGLALREGAGLAVANGLPYAEALAAITEAPARIWGIGDHYGRLAPGFDADVVIWDGDPLEPASTPLAVFIRGAPVSLTTRQTRLRDRYAPAHNGDGLTPAYR